MILPGNWGRILKRYKPSHPNLRVLVRELIFEQIRLREFASKPSRFETVFLCHTEEDILEFKNEYNRPLDLVYEVELVDSTSSSHVGDMALAGLQDSDEFESFAERARSYWKGGTLEKPETITMSPIRVKKLIDAT